MFVPLQHIRRARTYVSLLVLCGLFNGLPCTAQDHQRLPDSIPGSMETAPVTVDTTVSADEITAPSGGADTGRQKESSRTEPDSATVRAVPDSVFSRWKKDRTFAYANDPAYWAPEKEDRENKEFFLEKLFSSRIFQYSIYILLAGILLYALYRIIAENNLRVFYRGGARAAAGLTGENPSEENPEEGLEKALAANDHRLATRYLYLKTLRLLAEKELIRYHPQATNQEYLNEMNGLPQGTDFRMLTGIYERVWYGDFAINTIQFDRLHSYFQDFYKSIPSR